jgi:hypothetical protein
LLKERWRCQQESAPKTEEERLEQNAALFAELGVESAGPEMRSLVDKIKARAKLAEQEGATNE